MSNQKQKILCVLYDDPINGHPKEYARENIPTLKEYPGGQSMPSPSKIDFTPGELLGTISGGLGLNKFLEDIYFPNHFLGSMRDCRLLESQMDF